MPGIITSIIAESLEYNQRIKRELVARVLVNAKGRLRPKVVRGIAYVSLRRNVGKRLEDLHLGRADARYIDDFKKSLARRRDAIAAVKDARWTLKELGMTQRNIMSEDFLPVIRAVFEEFERLGLWEEAVTLIGSWCFKVYQNNCGVEYYPERTFDIDFAVRIPHHGREANIGQALAALGFEGRINYPAGDVRYQCGDMAVEFLNDRQGSGRGRKPGRDYEPQLGIAPVALPYLRVLLDNRVTLSVRGAGKVVVPAMPAFVLHKLLVAPAHRAKEKALKDYRQVEAVAKVVLRDAALVTELGEIAAGLHKKWRQRIVGSVQEGPDAALTTGAARELVARLVAPLG